MPVRVSHSTDVKGEIFITMRYKFIADKLWILLRKML